MESQNKLASQDRKWVGESGRSKVAPDDVASLKTRVVSKQDISKAYGIPISSLRDEGK